MNRLIPVSQELGWLAQEWVVRKAKSVHLAVSPFVSLHHSDSHYGVAQAEAVPIWSPSTLHLHLPASRTPRHKLLFIINYLIYGILLQQREID